MNSKIISKLPEALAICRDGGTEYHPYDQRFWGDEEFGTTCCLWGQACVLAGEPVGPPSEDLPVGVKFGVMQINRLPRESILSATTHDEAIRAAESAGWSEKDIIRAAILSGWHKTKLGRAELLSRWSHKRIFKGAFRE